MNEQPFLSLSEIARKANAPESRVRKLKQAGRLVPDFKVGRVACFRMERVPEIIQTLATEIQ